MEEQKVKLFGKELEIIISKLIPEGRIIFCNPEDRERIKEALFRLEGILDPEIYKK